MEWIARILAWVIILAVLYGVFSMVRRLFTGGGGGAVLHCKDCGTEAVPATRTRGSIWIEIVLWLCFIVPGVIYSLWRISTRRKVCSACGSEALIPVNSPAAQAAKKAYTA